MQSVIIPRHSHQCWHQPHFCLLLHLIVCFLIVELSKKKFAPEDKDVLYILEHKLLLSTCAYIYTFTHTHMNIYIIIIYLFPPL